jgi:hypothetical protein
MIQLYSACPRYSVDEIKQHSQSNNHPANTHRSFWIEFHHPIVGRFFLIDLIGPFEEDTSPALPKGQRRRSRPSPSEANRASIPCPAWSAPTPRWARRRCRGGGAPATTSRPSAPSGPQASSPAAARITPQRGRRRRVSRAPAARSAGPGRDHPGRRADPPPPGRPGLSGHRRGAAPVPGAPTRLCSGAEPRRRALAPAQRGRTRPYLLLQQSSAAVRMARRGEARPSTPTADRELLSRSETSNFYVRVSKPAISSAFLLSPSPIPTPSREPGR